MGRKHVIVSDLHHGSAGFVEFGKVFAKKEGGKFSASSTGDQSVYAANNRAPKGLAHGFTDAYQSGDKAGMKKHLKSWAKNVVGPRTTQSGVKLQELKPYLRGGRVNTIYGNSDYGVMSQIKAHDPRGIEAMLGGPKSAVKLIPQIQVKKDGKTTFVYLPHSPVIASRYKGMKYGAVRTRLGKEYAYRDQLRGLSQKIARYNTPNVVVLMHEAPAPERWYGKGTAKTANRLPAALKAHYDSVLETIVETSPSKNIKIFHGHLHEGSKKNYQYKGIKTRLLDIGDVAVYDTEKGTYRTRRVAPHLELLPAAKKQGEQKKYYGGQEQYAKAA